jgi:hypothetical protein
MEAWMALLIVTPMMSLTGKVITIIVMTQLTRLKVSK